MFSYVRMSVPIKVGDDDSFLLVKETNVPYLMEASGTRNSPTGCSIGMAVLVLE